MRRAEPRRTLTAAALAAALLGLLAAGCASNKRPPGDNQPTIATLAGKKVEVAPDPGIAPDEGKAIAAYRSFLDIAKNAPQRPDAMRRLADLEMELADRKSADSGATPDYKAAIAQYNAVLAQHPKARGNDRVLYQLARAQEQGGDLEAALKTLSLLVTEFPDTVHAEEAQFRRGELLFAMRQYVPAGEAYATVLRASGSAANSPFTERALYMRGWSLFKQGKLEDALHPFFGVLDLRLARLRTGAAPGPDPLAYLSRAERELLEDTYRVMSISLANLQGAASIKPYIRGELRQLYEHRVYEQLAELYLKQERIKDAADTLALFARERPLDAQAPVLLSRVIDIHEKNGFASLALESKKDFVVRYGRESEFRRANAEGWQQAQPLVKAHLAELARHHHALAQQSKAKPAVQEAVRWYREYLVAFPGDGDAAQNHFLLAELLYEDGQLAEAATNYEKVAYEYAAHAKGADAGYAALLSYAGQAKALPAGPERNALNQTGVESALRFAARYGSDARAGAVTTNAAETLLALGEAERASAVARQALGLNPGNDQRRTAHTVIAVSAFDRKLFAESEAAYAEALALAPERSAQAADLAERRSAAIYKQAEAAREGGRTREAIGHFQRVAQLAPQAAVRATAQYDVASILLGLKDWDAAAGALEEFRRAHPGHALQADVSAKLALAYTEQRRWSAAAGELERIAAAGGDVELRRSALWQAAELHAKAAVENSAANARAAAIRGYENYLRAWPAPLESAVEARWRLAKLTKDDGQAAKSLAWVRQVREADIKGGAARTERTRTLGALAALQLTEPQLEAYRKVALVEPLARNLKTKKTRMEEVLKAYAGASQDGGAEAVTAATFMSAAVYADFGKALMNSQRPKGLKKLELEQYNVMLEEQAFPFEEKAIELHETNARRTTQGVWDEWVARSFAALAQIKPVRYGKAERSEEVVDAIR